MNGWQAAVNNSVQDLAGNTLVPIDSSETWENYTPVYVGENWGGLPSPATWPGEYWQTGPAGAYFTDTYGLCWGGTPLIPPTTSWDPLGTTVIFTGTHKYWIASLAGFAGVCPFRSAAYYYTDHYQNYNVSDPIPSPSYCQQGQYAN